jgi:hypothetical protein
LDGQVPLSWQYRKTKGVIFNYCLLNGRLYKKARQGELTNLTGISTPYEEPETPEIVVETNHFSSEECGQQIINYLKINGYLTY